MIFINSLPKSGTNLLAKTLSLMGFKESGVTLDSGHFNRRNFMNFMYNLLPEKNKQGFIIGIDTPIQVEFNRIKRLINSIKENEYFVGHLGYTFELIEILKKRFKIIQIIRDPRAVLSSFVKYVENNKFHYLHLEFTNNSKEQRYLMGYNGFIKNNKILQPLKIRCNAMNPMIWDKEILTIKFENLIGEKGGGKRNKQKESLESICTHLNIKYNNEILANIQDRLFGSSKTFRKGEIDSWKNEIPSKITEYINADLNIILKLWDY